MLCNIAVLVYERRIIYMRGGKVAIYSDITSLVQPLISSSDEAVAQYESGVVRGVSPGTAHLKVSLLPVT